MNTLEVAFFALTALMVLLGGVATIAAKNPIRGAMGLLSTIIGVAGMYLLLAAELLAAVQVIVYAGAVVILFIFVIMLLGPSAGGIDDARGAVTRYFGAGLFALVGAGLLLVVTRMGGEALTRMPAPPAGMGTIEVIGRELFTRQIVPFQVAGILLLVAVIGAMAVARGNAGASSTKAGGPPPVRRVEIGTGANAGSNAGAAADSHKEEAHR